MKAPKTHETKGLLAKHYGFADKELGFIPSTLLRAGINYDIKYWMGQEAGEGGEE